jgi:hypothetical protein
MTNWFEGQDAGTQTELSSRPERTRISYIAATPKSTHAAFCKESRMKFANATKLDRKSGVAEWRDLRFSHLSVDVEVTVQFPLADAVVIALPLLGLHLDVVIRVLGT